jgi:hypothetical protein
MVLWTRGVGSGGIFDGSGGDISGGGSGDDGGTDGYAGYWGTGTDGTRLVLFSCSHLVWVLENTVQGLVRGSPGTLIPDTLAVNPKASQSTDSMICGP